jgi:hypothetical protein
LNPVPRLGSTPEANKSWESCITTLAMGGKDI